MAPTNTDSSVFIQIWRGIYRYTETILHYTKECRHRFVIKNESDVSVSMLLQ